MFFKKRRSVNIRIIGSSNYWPNHSFLDGVSSFVYLFLLLFAIALTSCKKDSASEPPPEQVSDTLWTRTNWLLSEKCVAALAIGSNGYIFAGTCDSGVYRSTNLGNSWSKPDTNLPSIEIRALATRAPNHVFAVTARGIYQSLNKGGSWSLMGLTTYTLFGVGVNSVGHIFVATKGSGVFRSKDDGVSWMQRRTGLGFNNAYVTIAIDDSDRLFMGGDGLYRSTDNGDTWINVDASGALHFVDALAINSNGDVFAGTTLGVFRSRDNGVTWSLKGTGAVSSLAINRAGYIFLGLYYDVGVRRSTDNGESWTDFGFGGVSARSLAIDSAGFLYAGTTTDGVYRTRLSTSY